MQNKIIITGGKWNAGILPAMSARARKDLAARISSHRSDTQSLQDAGVPFFETASN